LVNNSVSSEDEKKLVVASPEVWKMVSPYFKSYGVLESGHAYINKVKEKCTLPKVPSSNFSSARFF
jgi:hypothetical protein